MKYNFTPKQNLTFYLSKTGNLFHKLYKTPERKPGISVMIHVKNEEDWIGLSLQSLKSFADEVVIVDNGSTDRTVEEVKKIQPQLPYNIKLKQNPAGSMCEISNQALSLTTYRWVVRWGGDFIAFTTGSRNISKLRNYLLSLNRNNFYVIYPLLFNFSYDLFHLRKNKELHSENYIHTFHPLLKYEHKKIFVTLKVPFFFNVKRVLKIHFVHIGFVKPIEQLLERYFRHPWDKKEIRDEYPRMIDFIKAKAKEMWDTDKLKDIIQKIFDEQKLFIYKYDKEKYGDYPELLKPVLKNQPFKILYRNGKPYTRSDIPEFSEEKIDKSSELYQK
ncbi:MAG: glycosyltransferase [Candidatus Cloacimonetes bacterium]|nr:glycosyltransferase [Candidatus Cloacimonadota bacterium]MBL7086608.1 glycosyltransferase [Candidatus Cloacimonadota bacterium]